MKQPIQDRREHPRFSTEHTIKAKSFIDDFMTDAQLLDASVSGARFKTTKWMIEDDRVSLIFELPDVKDHLTLKGEVVWAKNEDDDSWEVGVEFNDVPFVLVQEMFRLLKII